MQILLTAHTISIYSRPLVDLHVQTKGPPGIVKSWSPHMCIQHVDKSDVDLQLSTVFCVTPN